MLESSHQRLVINHVEPGTIDSITIQRHRPPDLDRRSTCTQRHQADHPIR
jgi:hypothetical protein